MTRRVNKDALIRRQVFSLPSNPTPTGTRCVALYIPDDDDHESRLLGAIELLTKWTSWEQDGTSNAVDCAQTWKNAINPQALFRPCEMFDIRLKPTDVCTVQKTYNGGTDWIDAFSLRECADLAFNDGLVQALEDGIIAPGGQPGGDGSLTPGECKIYHVQMDANGKWHLPVSVSEGDTIRIYNATGGAFDGAFINWYCPNGDQYLAGLCTGTPAYEETDPLPETPHMSLILKLLSDDAYHPAYNTTVTIGAGYTDTDVDFMVNDDPTQLADNAGSYRFDVEVCKSTGVWCYRWEAPFSDPPITIHDDNTISTYAQLHFVDTLHLYQIEFGWDWNELGNGPVAADGIYANVFDFAHRLEAATNNLNVGHLTWDGDGTFDDIYVSVNGDNGVDPDCSLSISYIQIRGFGASNPFGSDNC